MSGEMINIKIEGGQLEAYLAKPKEPGPWPGIILLGEVYNVNHWVRKVADGYAEQGFIVLAPDLYWRQEAGRYLDYTPEDQKIARALGFSMDLEAFTGDMIGYIKILAEDPECTGKVGTVGFCLGGKLVYLAMARGLADAGVAYYPVQVEQFLEEADGLTGPLMIHFAELDEHVPPESYKPVKAALGPLSNVDIFMYENADHGFNRFGYPPYHQPSADLALERTLSFLNTQLA